MTRLAYRRLDEQALVAAQRQGFVMITSVRQTAHIEYARWCRAHRRPMVRLRLTRGAAVITCDMDTAGWRLDAAAIERVNRLRNRPPSEIPANTAVGYVLMENVPRAYAPTVAFRLFELAMDCRPPEDLTR